MLFEKQRIKLQKASIRYIIFIYFTLTALAASIFIGISLYSRLSGQMSATIREENQILINQITRSMEDYLRTVMKLSDSLYYGVVKNADLASGSIGSEMTLLYDNNKDNVENIALLSKEGKLLEAVPAARLKTNVDVTGENWFTSTLEKTENMHFPRLMSSTFLTAARTSTGGSFPCQGQWRSPGDLPRTRESC